MVQRYNPIVVGEGKDTEADMDSAQYGDWVAHDDYAELEAERDSMKDAIRQAIELLEALK